MHALTPDNASSLLSRANAVLLDEANGVNSWFRKQNPLRRSMAQFGFVGDLQDPSARSRSRLLRALSAGRKKRRQLTIATMGGSFPSGVEADTDMHAPPLRCTAAAYDHDFR